MRNVFFLALVVLSPSLSLASQVVECVGEDIFGSKAVAQIFLEDGRGRIVITSSSKIAQIDVVESITKIEDADGVLQIWDNDFAMQFSVSKEQPTFPIDAFRDGAFWVTDFSCQRVY
jgi:hypothetical protein